MGKSFKISLRFNPEYDQFVINKLQSIKDNRNMSKILRKIIREGLSTIEIKQSNALSDKKDYALSNNKNDIIKPKLINNTEIETKKNKKEPEPVKWNWPK